MAANQSKGHYFVASAKRTKKAVKKVSPQTAVREVCNNHLGEEGNEMVRSYRDKYREWFHLLGEGFNIILSGIGSKARLLTEFTDRWLCDETHVVIHGYVPRVTKRKVEASLMKLLRVRGGGLPALQFACQRWDANVYIVIHSIDLLLSSNPRELQDFLTSLILSSEGRVHLIASTDHVNAAILWDNHKKTHLNLFHVNVPTFIPYETERGCILAEASYVRDEALDLSSVQNVFEGLTPNSQKIFLLLLNHYNHEEAVERKRREKTKRGSEEPEKKRRKVYGADDKQPATEGASITFSRLYKMCREKFLVNSEVTLKSQLVELKDHKIVKVSKNEDAVLAVRLLISMSVVKQFLEINS